MECPKCGSGDLGEAYYEGGHVMHNSTGCNDCGYVFGHKQKEPPTEPGGK